MPRRRRRRSTIYYFTVYMSPKKTWVKKEKRRATYMGLLLLIVTWQTWALVVDAEEEESIRTQSQKAQLDFPKGFVNRTMTTECITHPHVYSRDSVCVCIIDAVGQQLSKVNMSLTSSNGAIDDITRELLLLHTESSQPDGYTWVICAMGFKIKGGLISLDIFGCIFKR